MEIGMLHAEAIFGPPENASGIFQHYASCQAGTPSKLGCMEYNKYITKGGGAAVTYAPHFTSVKPAPPPVLCAVGTGSTLIARI